MRVHVTRLEKPWPPGDEWFGAAVAFRPLERAWEAGVNSTSGLSVGTQNFTFSNNDNGVPIFSYTFNALGFQTITISDTSNNSITGSIVVAVFAQSGGGGGP